MKSFKTAFKNGVSVLSIAAITVQPVLAQDVVGDGSVTAPDVTTTQNGVPLIIINTPGANGLSYNTYDQFNVGPNGVILNNIATEFGSSLQGGLIAGNANLTGGAASVILNEVLAANPTSLTGYLEVAGTEADVIIANPWGITCNGCGFLNTDRLTLTTGTTVFEGGSFTGFSVDGGTIFIGDSGLDATDTTRFDLISRQLTFGGPVVGNDIRVTVGRNDVIYATGAVTAKGSDGSAVPGFGIDSTLLGGMYANAITLNSTEAGVGVRAPTNMAASTGGMTLTADGRLIIGKAATTGTVRARASNIEIGQSLIAKGLVELTADEAIELLADVKLVSEDEIRASAGSSFRLASGSAVVSTGAVDLEAGTTLSTSGAATIAAGATGANGTAETADLTLSAGAMDLAGVTAVASGDLSVEADIIDIAADGTIPEGRFIAGGDATIAAETVSGGLIAADGSIALTGDNLTLTAGKILAQGGLTATGASLTNGSQLQGETVALEALTGALVNSGVVLSGGALSLSAATDLTNSGALQAFGAITVDAGEAITNSGAFETLSTLTIAATELLTNTTTGELLGGAGVSIAADEIVNAGAIASSGGSVRLRAVEDITNSGLAYARGLLDLGADGTILNDGGALLATGAMALQGASGAEAAGIINQDGGLIETFAGDIYLAADSIQNLGPDVEISEDQDVDQTGWVIQPDSGSCSGSKENCHEMRLTTGTATEVVTLTGQASMIVSAGDLIITGGDFLNEYSLVSAAGDIGLNLDSFTNAGVDLQRTVLVTENHRRTVQSGWWDDEDTTYWNVERAPVVTDVGHVFATIEAGGDIAGVISGYVTNGAVSPNGPLTATGSNPDLSATGPAVSNLVGSAGNTSGATSGIIGNPALFVTTTDPDADYLVETRYEFIDLENFISSDALLNHFLDDAALAQLRLGDAYVETLFVRRQLFELTGEAPIDERERMRALYDNAIGEGERLDLRPGVALTPEQIAALQEDIIWLETVVIDGREVLIPRVYLAPQDGVLLSGASLRAEDVTLWAEEFTNSGLIAASENLYIKTEGSFLNLAGSIQAGDLLALDVGTTFTSLNGYLTATDIAIAAEDIAIRTEAFRTTGEDGFADGVSAVSTLNASGDLSLYASNNIEITGANLAAGDDLALRAGGDITGGTTLLTQSVDFREGESFVFVDNRTNLTNLVTAGGDLSLISGTGDIVLNGGTYTAGEVLTVAALGGSVALNAVADTEFSDSHFAGGNWIGSVEYRDQVFDLENQVVTLEGTQIDVYALGNILADGTRFRVPGATLAAADLTTGAPTGNLTLTAEYGDIYIGAPTDIHAETHLKSTSYLGGLMGSTTDLRTLQTTHVGSVMTVAGDINLTAGRDLTLVAADITAGGAFSTDVGGDTRLLAAVDLDYLSLFEMSNNGILIVTETTERLTEEAFHTRIDAASVSFDATSPVTIGAYRDPFIDGGHPSGWLGDGASGHMALADSLLGLTPPADDDPADDSTPSDWRIDLAAYGVVSELPSGAGYDYLEELAARPDTTVQPIVLLDYSYYDKDTQISPAAMALLSIAVGQFVGGWGIWEGMNATLAAAGQKAIASVITQSVAGVVSGEFDLGEILEGAAFAGLSAGLTAGINADDLGLSFGPNAGESLLGVGDNFTLAALVEGTIDAGLTAGLSSAVYGTSFGDAFVDSLTAAVTASLLADTQTLIGDQGLVEGSAGHAFLHGLAGCAFAEVSDGDCAAGFAAGVVGSLYAGTLDINAPGYDRDQALNTAELLGAFAGFVFSSGQGANVTLAGTVSQSGVENNYLTHAQWDAYLTALERCGTDQVCIEAENKRYFDLSAANTVAMLECGSDLTCLAPHIAAMLETQSDAALTARFVSLQGVVAPGIVDVEHFDRAYLAGSPAGWGGGFVEFSANNCASLGATACLGAWYEEQKANWLIGGATDAATGMLLSLGVAVTPSTLTWLRACAGNMVCLNELAIAAGQAAAGDALAGATLTFSAAVGGKLVLQHGDEILGVLDDAGRFFKPLAQEADNAGRFLVQAADGTVGYLDDASRFVAVDSIASVKPMIDPSINIASTQRTQHILYGDQTGGGHLWPGAPGKTAFPQSWDAEKVMTVTSDLATDPNLYWKPQTGSGGLYTKSGKPARFVVTDSNGNLPIIDGVPVKIIIEPAGEGIITAHPQY